MKWRSTEFLLLRRLVMKSMLKTRTDGLDATRKFDTSDTMPLLSYVFVFIESYVNISYQ